MLKADLSEGRYVCVDSKAKLKEGIVLAYCGVGLNENDCIQLHNIQLHNM